MAGLVLLVPLLVLVLAGLVVLATVAASARPDHTLTRELASARRHGVVTSAVAVGVMLLTVVLTPTGVTVAGLTVVGLDGARLAAVLPLAGSAAALLVLLLGELTWPRPRGVTRSALVHDRSVSLLLRGRWAAAAGTAVGLLALTTVAGGLLAHDDDRSLRAEVRAADGTLLEAHGASPFPGWEYGVPQLVVLGAALVVLALVLRAATTRATVVTADLETDRLLRRASAARAYRTLTFGALVTAGVDLAVAGQAARRVFDGWQDQAALGVLLLGVTCCLAALVVALVPAPRLARPAPASPEPVRA
ncbi:MAG TPA: hypothetical protein VFV40_07240 [Nocardioides sp.]|nr:hypothetical protein [Nocardioides sp.]